MNTFALITMTSPALLTSEHQAISYVFASLLTLGQIIGLFPRYTKSVSVLWIMALLSIVPYVSNAWEIQESHRLARTWDNAQHLHPIESLVINARSEFDNFRNRQSTNYTAAETEYHRRYGIAPPPGLEDWFHYAVDHNSLVIDDYDAIFHAIAPFLQLSGKAVSKLMHDAQHSQASDLWACALTGPKSDVQCKHSRRRVGKDRDISKLLNELLGPIGGALQDVTALVNHLDEPRVVAAPQKKPDGHFKLRNLKRTGSWSQVTKHCSESSKDGIKDHTTTGQSDLPFVLNRSVVMDLCHHDEYKDMHGLFMSPTNLRLIEGHVPVLSTGSFSTMEDILIPSPAYIQSRFQYRDTEDVSWDKKRNNLYWDGSNTGGFAEHNGLWRGFHRQRFVSLVQNLETQRYSYLSIAGGRVVRTASDFLNGRLYDVAFTRIFQCVKASCRAQRHFFRTRSWRREDAALRSRLVFDIDGNGISGRFYRLLASQSLPLKQTLLREWHDERLMPWVHYVPISQSLEELPEVVSWLTSTTRGQEIAKGMAEAGRNWYFQALRDLDKSVYLYRVMLEMKRLQNDTRAAGDS
jgi:hypothetical protein